MTESELKLSEEIEEHDFRGLKYKAYKHEFFRHENERESRLRFLNVGPNESMIDVGAAAGSWSIPAALTARRVYAIEPFCNVQREIIRNITLNRLQNVELIGMAAWDYMGERELKCMTASIDGLQGAYYMVKTKCFTLDDFVEKMKIEDLGYIKIDVEGAELRVLAGAVKTLKRFLPKVLVEVHCSYGVTVDSVLNFFSWINPHYSATTMQQGMAYFLGDVYPVFGQFPACHYHAFFEIAQPACPEFIAEFGRPEKANGRQD